MDRSSLQAWGARAAAVLRAAALALALATGAVPAAQAGEWQASEDDQLLLELRSAGYRLGEPLRGYQVAGEVCVDFGDLVRALDLPIRVDIRSRRATGWIFAEGETFVLDRDADEVRSGSTRARLAAGDLHDTPEGWCISLAALSRWFGVAFRADISNLAVTLESPRKLPLLAAIERKSRAARLRSPVQEFDLAGVPRAEMPYHPWRAPAVDLVVGGAWRKPHDGPSGREIRYEAFASGEAFGTSYEARLTTTDRGIPDRLRFKAYRIDPSGGMLGPLGVTQLAAGDVETFAGALTGQSAVGRGLFLSNRPVTPASRFSKTTLRGDLPAGWDAELYRNGQLLAFQGDSGTGRYTFDDVDLRMGENGFEVVLYGPQGQIRRERSSYPVTAESVPAGTTRYWAGLVQPDRDLIDFSGFMADPLTGWRWGVGVERGIDRRTSLGLGAQSLILDNRRRTYLEATLRRGLGPFLVELAGAQQLGRGEGRVLSGQMLGRLGGVNLRANALWAFGGYESEVIGADQAREFGISLDQELRLASFRLPLQLGYRQALSRDGTRADEASFRTSVMLRGLSLTAELSKRRMRGPRADGQASGGSKLRLLANTRIAGLRLRGNARFQLSGPDRGFAAAELTAERALDLRTDLSARIDYDRLSRKADFGLGVVRQFSTLSLRADTRLSSRGDLGVGLSLAMSFGSDPVDGGWRVSANKLAQFGAAAVTVFRDENGDGTRQPSEEPLEGVTIAASGRGAPATTDARGAALVDGLQPFREVLVAVDAGSIADPLLVPKGRGVVLVPRPGVAAEILLAVTPTGEVEGTMLDAAGEPREGVALELADGTGQVVAETRSEFDGYFLFDRVPYGDYRLRIGRASAQALGVAADSGHRVRIDRQAPTVRTGAVRLVARAD